MRCFLSPIRSVGEGNTNWGVENSFEFVRLVEEKTPTEA
jgi:hypothetical protein